MSQENCTPNRQQKKECTTIVGQKVEKLSRHVEKLKALGKEAVEFGQLAEWEAVSTEDLQRWGRRVRLQAEKICSLIQDLKERWSVETAFDDKTIHEIMRGKNAEDLSNFIFVLSNQHFLCGRDDSLFHITYHIQGKRNNINQMKTRGCTKGADCDYRKNRNCNLWSPPEQVKAKVYKLR